MMELMGNLKHFYQEVTWLSMGAAIFMFLMPIAILILSFAERMKFALKNFDGSSLKRYCIGRLWKIAVYLCCSAVSAIVAFPMIHNGYVIQTPKWSDVIIVALYFLGLSMLLCLGEGIAAFMHSMTNLSLLVVVDKYFPDISYALCFIFLGVFFFISFAFQEVPPSEENTKSKLEDTNNSISTEI